VKIASEQDMEKAQAAAGVFMRAMWDAMVELDALPLCLVVVKDDELMVLRPDWPAAAMPSREEWAAVWPGNQPSALLKMSAETRH
jgi:hypothetical protein